MRNFQVASGIRKRSFISAFSICMTLPLSFWLSYSSWHQVQDIIQNMELLFNPKQKALVTVAES